MEKNECILRPWRMEDVPALASTLSNEKILRNLRDGLPYPYTEKDAAAYLSAVLAAPAEELFAFAITVEGKVVGNITAERQRNIHRQTAELGYYLGEAFWGRGIMTSAVRQICHDVFAESDILRIFAQPFAENIASCRVLEKAGFTQEGVLRKNAVKNGRVLDMKLYSLVR